MFGDWKYATFGIKVLKDFRWHATLDFKVFASYPAFELVRKKKKTELVGLVSRVLPGTKTENTLHKFNMCGTLQLV